MRVVARIGEPISDILEKMRDELFLISSEVHQGDEISIRVIIDKELGRD
ncbi:hypothetical protein [Brevibacillus formosus]